MVWRIGGAVALVVSVIAVAMGFVAPAQAAIGECTADPSPTTTTTSSPTTSTTTPAVTTQAVIVTGVGPGGGPHVRVIAADDHAELAGFYAYGAEFHGGVSVAAGDVNGDGYDDIITAAGPGGGPHVRIFNGAPNGQSKPTLNELGGFYAYVPNFTGGVTVAAGDVNNDGKMDIVTGPGPGGGPHVRIFNGATVLGATPTIGILGEFMAYSPAFSGGVSVAAADLGAGGPGAEIVTGAGPGGGPHVLGLEANGTVVSSFMAAPLQYHGGVNVAAACTEGVARIAVATASQVSGVSLFRGDGQPLEGGFGYDTEGENVAFEGLGVALGTVFDDEDPPVQIVVGFSDGDPQVVIAPASDAEETLDGFDAYGVKIRITLAVGHL